MLASKLNLDDDFPPADYADWRTQAETDLQGASFEHKLVTRTYEGIDVQPVYTNRDWPAEEDPYGFPGLPPFVRGSRTLGAVKSGWDLRQEHAHPDLEVSNRAILEDLDGGVTSLLLRLDCTARGGLDPDDSLAEEMAGRDGILAYHVDDLDALLKDVELRIAGVTLEAGAAFMPAAAQLAALWRRRGVPPSEVRGAFNADPLAVLVRDGQLPMSLNKAMSLMAELAKWTAENHPQVTSVRVGTAAYHHAGATAAQDLGFSMATAVEYLRAMTGAGLDVAAAARQLLFSLSLGTHQFLAIAKLRAARRMWSRVMEVCGGPADAAAMRIHARTSKRVLTTRDPYVNLLRNTVAVFAAGIGGAEAITSTPFDAPTELPDEFSRRVARNTLLVLQEEAHLNRVVDPPGGSWYLDWLTQRLAEQAWAILQDIEGQGGMLHAIENGWVADQIESAFAPRAKGIASRKEGITGVSEYPDLAETRAVRTPPDRERLRAAATERVAALRRESASLSPLASAATPMAAAVEAALAGASIGQLSRALGLHAEPTTIAPLAPHPFAKPFEELRDASDAWQAAHGRRPRVFLANMGPVAHHTARATYAKNFFEAGGFEVITNNGFSDADQAAAAFAASGARIAVICSSDKLYPKLVPGVARELKSAGARTVVLAGNPGAHENAWQQAGVDRFIFIKCDVLATLRELLCEEGVLNP